MGETVTETWFSNIWKSSRKSISWEPERPTIRILSFEVSRLMSKVVNLWACLADNQIVKLREEIINSLGIQKLVSEDIDYLMDLALSEIIENFTNVAKSVVILGKKCADPGYHDLEKVFDDPGGPDPKWDGWQYRVKKIERKIKKMERFVAATEQLYQELDVLAELEQTLRRMRCGANLGQVKLLEFQKKVIWQRQEVKNLQEMSPWVRTYDYIVRILLRSLFTIHAKITHNVSFYKSKHRISNPPPDTLGYAALSLRYANLIILIEKFASSPHLISLDARDDLYNMLPESIRIYLRGKLRLVSRTLSLSVYNDALAADWRLAIAMTLEWLSPLAYNMVKWQSERNFEAHRLIFGSNVLLVKTIYFANREKTDAVIVELLMGLNYLSRFGREFNGNPFRACT